MDALEILSVSEPGGCGGCAPNSTTEVRDYQLNHQTALKEKLKSTDRDDISIIQTGGGVKFMFSTGMYELIKLSAESFYNSTDLTNKCQILPVLDTQGSLVETKYKITQGRKTVYTLNMYHTKSSCLVNGKRANIFIDTDLPEILKIVETNLVSSGVSVSEVNDSIKDILHTCTIDKNRKCKRKDNVQIKALPLNSSAAEEDCQVVEMVENCTQTNPDISVKKNEQTQTPPDSLDINKTVQELRATLETHIRTTSRQFEEIKDILNSIKIQNRCNSKTSSDEVEIVRKSTEEIQHQIKGVDTALMRRFQSISDCLKTKQNRVDTEATNDTCASSTQLPVNPTETSSQLNPAALSSDQNVAPKIRSPKTSRRSQQWKTLLIGDSLFRGISSRGLTDDTRIETMPGKTTVDIRRRLNNIDMSAYNNIVVYVGGNDLANQTPLQEIEDEFRHIISSAQNNKDCSIFICTLCPRRDVDVDSLNKIICKICETTSATIIDSYSAFVYCNGNAEKRLFHRDGIHLSVPGSSTLVKVINNSVKITKQRVHKEISVSSINMQQTPVSWRPDTTGGWRRVTMGGWRQPKSGSWRTQNPRRSSRPYCIHCNMTNHTTKECRRNLKW